MPVRQRGPRSVEPASRRLRSPPSYEPEAEAHNSEQHQGKRNRAPPLLPEGGNAMTGLTPGPEDANKQDGGARNLKGSTHNAENISPAREATPRPVASHPEVIRSARTSSGAGTAAASAEGRCVPGRGTKGWP